MSILEKIEKRVDKVIVQEEKEEVAKVIEYRNIFIKDIENYILAREARQPTKEYKVKILDTFKLFSHELKKEKVIEQGKVSNDSSIESRVSNSTETS
jgi:hypothetical protein